MSEQSPTGGRHPVCSVGRVLTVHVPQVVAAEVEDGLPSLDACVLQGRLKNLESMHKLYGLLGHLSGSKWSELAKLIVSYPCLFSDTPTQIPHLIEHDIDVGDSQLVRQCFYRVSPAKHKHLDAEIQYMLD